ncbi:FliM/FliN family flagellar motor switch protein [bacterium]|nr:FliM/FliN family flagellar motor switch protein [bacterium]
MKVKLHLEGEISRTTITAEEMINLKIGDIIRLDNRIYDDIIVKIVNIAKYFGKIGLLHGKKAIQITGRYNIYDQNRNNLSSDKKKKEFKKSEML